MTILKKLSILSMALWVSISFTKSAIADPTYCPSNTDNPTLFQWNGTIPSGWTLGPASGMLPQHDIPVTLINGLPADTFTFLFASLSTDAKELSCTYIHLGNNKGYAGPTALLGFYKKNITKDSVTLSSNGDFQSWFIQPSMTPAATGHEMIQCGNPSGQGAKVTDCPFNI